MKLDICKMTVSVVKGKGGEKRKRKRKNAENPVQTSTIVNR